MKKMLQELIGKKINKIYFNQEYLKFETDKGNVVYTVEGDCCSSSYFQDFYGVKKLLENGPVISFEEVEDTTNFSQPDRNKINDYDYCIQVYGFKIVTEHEFFGEQTSVFSFRNASNGYYGGYMCLSASCIDVQPEITDDVTEAASYL